MLLAGELPRDWPDEGTIDIGIHDSPHHSARTEWWYLNGHALLDGHPPVSFFAAFFISAADPNDRWDDKVHAVTWAITDAATSTYHSECRVDDRAPQLGLRQINDGHGMRDELFNRAMAEILEAGNVPRPDRMIGGDVRVESDPLLLRFGRSTLRKRKDDLHLRVIDDASLNGCDIKVMPTKRPIRHGENGLVPGALDGEVFFYYFIPRCTLAGTVRLDGVSYAIDSGCAWYDHEFGGVLTAATDGSVLASSRMGENVAWNWVGIQLDNGCEVSAYEILAADTSQSIDRRLVFVERDGSTRSTTDVSFESGPQWRSVRTFQQYPMSMVVRSSGIELHVTPDLVDQEFITTIAPPAFWEGSCSVTGDLFGGVVQGRAFFERKGFHRLATVESFFGEVGSEVIANVEPLLPSTPTHESLLDLLAYRPGYDCLKGVNPESIGRNLLAPIREIVDRGGKAWRSYAAVACCDVVGGDSRKFRKWLALPELVHSGSLIVDDVEDQSETRRGGPTCHRLFGEPLAINAGTFAYFLAEKAIREMDGLTDETRLRIYELYFGAMRAAHAGQALDLGGAGHEVAAAIASGETERLEARVLACYRLKSGVPASAFAAMGAIVGGGTEVQVTAISDLFESLGTAFQIRDDVLNLRGFARGLKSKGEDVSNGTVTLVVAKAIGVLPPELRRHLWGLLQSKRESQSDIADVIAILEACGSVSDCDVLARDLVEHAWDTVEHHFEPSIAKLTLRAFSWYLLEREY